MISKFSIFLRLVSWKKGQGGCKQFLKGILKGYNKESKLDKKKSGNN